MIDYSRNWGLNQERLKKGKVTIVGAGALTNYLCFYMAGLGLKKMRIIEDSCANPAKEEFLVRDVENEFKILNLEDKLKAINSDLDVESVPLGLDGSLIGNPDVLLDLSNNPESKKKCTEHFYGSKIKLLVSASTSPTTGSAIFKREKGKVAKALAKDFLGEFRNSRQGGFTSGVMAAVILDEVRKTVSPLEGDYELTGRINYGLSLKGRFSHVTKANDVMIDSFRNVLLCGAGGIGTYVALNLVLEDINVDFFDGDAVEDHNVARQLFYHDSIGRMKADVLESRLKEIDPYLRINGQGSYITEQALKWLPRYDAMICCADNWEARRVMNKHAIDTGTPLINTSVTAFSAMAEAYLPRQNSCLACRYDLDKLSRMQGQSCAELQETNVVMTNAFIGAFAVGELLAMQAGWSVLDNKFEYHSKKGKKRKFNIINKEARCQCTRERMCKCHTGE